MRPWCPPVENSKGWGTLGVNDSGYEPNRAYSFFAVGGSRPFSRK